MKNTAKKVRTESTKKKIMDAINLHEKMKGSYFFRPPGNASGRRHYEKVNSMAFEFRFDGKAYSVELTTDCSCRNVYYRADIRVDGEKKNISALKKIV